LEEATGWSKGCASIVSQEVQELPAARTEFFSSIIRNQFLVLQRQVTALFGLQLTGRKPLKWQIEQLRQNSVLSSLCFLDSVLQWRGLPL
jgi:hypothetical protein